MIYEAVQDVRAQTEFIKNDSKLNAHSIDEMRIAFKKIANASQSQAETATTISSSTNDSNKLLEKTTTELSMMTIEMLAKQTIVNIRNQPTQIFVYNTKAR